MSTLDNPGVGMQDAGSPWPISIRFGTILGVVGIVLGLILVLMFGSGEIPSNGMLIFGLISIASIVVAILFRVRAVKAYREESGGYVTFGKAFQVAFFTGLVAMGIAIIFQILMETVIVSDMEAYTEGITRMFTEPFIADPDAVEEALDAQRPLYKGLGRNLFGSLIGGVFGGALISLIIGAIMKKTPPEV